jgi:hypothetical protein
MKRFPILLLLCLGLTACPGTNPSNPTTPAALAPGYNNATDQQLGSILSGARAFYTSIQQQSAAGKLVLTSTEKMAFNTFGATINAAESVYLAYHAGTATEQAAQTAVTAVQTQQKALPLPGGATTP